MMGLLMDCRTRNGLYKDVSRTFHGQVAVSSLEKSNIPDILAKL